MRVERDSGLTPDLALEVWHRRKWVVATVVFAGVAAIVTATLSLPDLYRASASVLVERDAVSEAFVQPSVTAELETRIQTIHQRVTSRARLAEVITSLGLYPELRDFVPLEGLVGRMRRDIVLQLRGVEQANGGSATIAFTVGFTGRDPATVATVSNTLAGFYVEENSQSRERQAGRTADFLKRQLAEVKGELDVQERQAGEFTLRYTDELPQQLEANLAAVERLHTQLRLNGEYQLRLLERRERIEQDLAEGGTAPSATATTPGAQLVRLRQRLAELRRQFSDEYPDVKRVTAEIAALEQQLARPGPDGAPASGSTDPAARLRQALQEADAELGALRREEAAFRTQIAGYETRIESVPRRQYEIQQLTRGYEGTKQRYDVLQKQYEAAQLAASVEQGHAAEQFRILDPAIPPRQPAAPNRLWLAMVGLIGSLALAAAAVVAIEKIDTTFHTVDDLRSFVEVPTLAAIRQIPTRAATRRQRLRFGLMAAAVAVGLALVVAGTYYIAGGNEQLVRLTMRGTA